MAVMVLWLAILWLKYKELIPRAQEQLGMVAKEVGPRYVPVSDELGVEGCPRCIGSV
jgi:hypothetical protein